MEKWCRLTNTTYCDVAASLPLPALPVSCGAPDLTLRSSPEELSSSVAGADFVVRAAVVADFLARCDVSYLDLKEEIAATEEHSEGTSWLHKEVLRHNSQAFRLSSPGLVREQNNQNSLPERKPFDRNISNGQLQADVVGTLNEQIEVSSSVGSKKTKTKKKEHDPIVLSVETDNLEHQDIVGSFKDLVDNICGKVEVANDDQEETEQSSLSLSDIRRLANEILSVRARKVLHLVPIDALVRLLAVLDHQVLSGQGLSVDDNSDADALVLCALEAIYSALAIMTHQDMPKQLYKEEVIERVLDFTKHQMMDIMAACDPSYRAIHRPGENGRFNDAEDNDDEADFGSAGKKRSFRNMKVKKSTGSGNKVSAIIYTVVQKLCSILGFLKDLLSVEKLSDSCILQLAKMSFSTFLAENIQLLQLKAIDVICGIYASYAHHRNFLIDETVQLLWKLPFSKRALRSYHLPDDEQKHIQMITALLIQLVQCSANLLEIVKSKLSFNLFPECSVDVNYPTKCQKAATETCCQFWTSVVERFTAAKSQDVSELKVIIENLVIDLLATLNLPEFPASASILEVLCVLLLENTGLKCKEMAARCATVDLLGTVAARLKRDTVKCINDKFWVTEGIHGYKGDNNGSMDQCCICLNEKSSRSTMICPICQRHFHPECVGITDQQNLFRDWSCHICISKKQLMVLSSYCKSQTKKDFKRNSNATSDKSAALSSITMVEVVQQILLNYLQEASSEDDTQLFTCWFYLCSWYKDDPQSQENIIFYLSRLKSKAVLRDAGTVLSIPREWAKKICLALGQNNSFSRGFDNILSLLLASLRENSPILRAKALRAVSGIVEADPEVLCDKRIQSAVEGRFCDSAISVREAALELVGRHIASHPDVGLKYFEKVAERIKDTGVSVRKRSIKIIRDMCMSNDNFSDVSTAFIEIISRVGDEESSIQDLVCKTFYELWFEESSSAHTLFVSDGSSVPLEVAKKTEQIVDLFRKMPNRQLLVVVIKRNLALDFLPQSAKASGINAVSLASTRKRCELMCKHLLERILQVEEANSDNDEVHALPYVLAVQAFCVVDPTLCAPATDPSQFVVTLQPYLKNQVDNRSAAQLLESILYVVDAVMPLLRKPPQNVLEELEQDLKHMIYRHSYLTVVHACIKCLCSLSKLMGKGASLIEYLIRVFLKQLHVTAVGNKQLLGRSLFCLGLLVRYGNALIFSSEKQKEYVGKSLQLLKNYLLSEDFSLKVRSLQALGYILIAKPEYMLEIDIRKILGASLSPSTDPQLKIQALQNIFEYLLDVEKQMEEDSTNNGLECMQDAGNVVPIAAGAGDTNICGGIVQLYWNNILECCMDTKDQVRQSALKIVEIVLRQGLVHPITCVPHLIALETDPQEVIAKLAHHLLMNMNEKYPSFFESRLGDGLQMSFKFFQSIIGMHNPASVNAKGKSTVSAFSCVRPGICRIYRLIRANRNSRNKFMHSIIRKFEPGSWSFSSIPFLVYCTEILASLPFTCPDEPLYLIYDINRILQVRAGPIESNLKMWCSSFFQGHLVESFEAAEVHPDTSMQQISDQSAMVMVKETLDGTCGISKETMQKLQSDCHDAIALQLLLKLKRHLKIAYNLNDARCQAFSLKEHPKPGEVLSKQSIPFNINEAPIALPSSYKDMLDKYQELKQLLRDDTLDYATYTSNIKRKRPTPRTSKRKAAPARGDDAEDGYSDDDWTGGPRKLSFGVPQSNDERVTRQRYNQNLSEPVG